MIPVARIRALVENTTYAAAYDLAEDIAAELPASGVVLSAEEVAQVKEAIVFYAGFTAPLEGTRAHAVLALLDGADEVTA